MVRRIGITGGMGSGKSTALKFLGSLGALVLDADSLARDVVNIPSVRTSVEALLGADVYTSEGVFDRAKVRERVFSDPALRRGLESITHPAIAALFAEQVARVEAVCPTAWVFYEASLLVETGRTGEFDAIVLVTAPPDVRVQRLEAGRGVPRESALAAMAAQSTDEEKRLHATFVLENGGTPEALESALWVLLKSLREKFSATPT
ncbi:MAG: dephospho-CoA kinase [Silvanigrellales bacterium]|nr:dephospho-CoA kinase [Silvanigrellales bacterium]